MSVYRRFKEEVRKSFGALCERLGFEFDRVQSKSPFVVFRKLLRDDIREFVVFQKDKYGNSFTIELSLTTVDNWALSPYAHRDRIGVLLDPHAPLEGQWEGIFDFWWEWKDESEIPKALEAAAPILAPAIVAFEKDNLPIPLVRKTDSKKVAEETLDRAIRERRERFERIEKQRESWYKSLISDRKGSNQGRFE